MDRRDEQLAAEARQQHGVFSVEQAHASGFTSWSVRRRVEGGRWERLDHHAYRVAVATPPTSRQMLMAATLASGGCASGASAGALHGWCPFPAVAEVLMRRGHQRKTDAVDRVTDTLPDGDIVIVEGIRATSPARTLIDLAGTLPREQFQWVLDRALFTNVVRRHRLETRARELLAPRRAGASVVLRELAGLNPEVTKARSVWEAKLLRLFDRRQLPRPEVNVPLRINGTMRRLDFVWRELGVCVEFDGFATHSARLAFEDDRTRQNEVVDQEWALFRLTARAIQGDVDSALAPLERTLARRAVASSAASRSA